MQKFILLYCVRLALAFLLAMFTLTGQAKTYKTIKAPETYPCTLPTDWLQTDTITIRGRIEGYDADLFGFTSMECWYEDVFKKDATTLVLEIAPDGTFEKKFQASYPVLQSFLVEGSQVGFYRIPFFARPGETIDITVRNDENGKYQCIYNSGSSCDVVRLLRSDMQFGGLTSSLNTFKGKFSEANEKAESIWQKMMYRLQTTARREHFTPMEMQLAMADAQVVFAQAFMDYVMYREFDLKKQEYRNGVYCNEILDSVEWNQLFDEKNYKLLHRIDFDNPMLLTSSSFPLLLNRMQFAKPVTNRLFKEVNDENGVMEYNVKNALKKLTVGQSALRDLMAVEHNNLMTQLCIYKDMTSEFNSWRLGEEVIPQIMADTTMTETERQQLLEDNVTLSKMFPAYLDALTHPYIKQKARLYHAYKMAQTELSTPLPYDNCAADIIRSLCAKYPGRYLMVDFWGMGCGPCRATIQNTKNLRAEIAKRGDVKLVFIAGEKTTEGSDAYKEYVAEWLANEETVCVTTADFARLQDLFQFNGIPHYETITPDDRRVRDDLRINGYYNFDEDLIRLKDKLTQLSQIGKKEK